jgi:cell cycle checkpoint protein
MSSSTLGRYGDAPDLVYQLDCVQGMVEALSSARWKRHQVSGKDVLLARYGQQITLDSSIN